MSCWCSPWSIGPQHNAYWAGQCDHNQLHRNRVGPPHGSPTKVPRIKVPFFFPFKGSCEIWDSDWGQRFPVFSL
uniref:Uncharacterized protein n=1 Tax=Anguilla anguilla TaxID=7936 RepID=A0A0E9WWP7_ANGAN